MQQSDKSTVLVTGGSRGIGAAIVNLLESQGYFPVVLDIASPGEGFKGDYVELDLSDAERTAEVLKQVVERYRVLRLVNNVGIVRPATVDETTPDDFQSVLDTNARIGHQPRDTRQT
jgi:NAD(P)-dependent dehydrogenase (short-subunit alcohol dehydrogenase family)